MHYQALIIVSEDENSSIFKHHLLNVSVSVLGGHTRHMQKEVQSSESVVLDFSTDTNPLGSPFRFEGSGLDMVAILEKAILNMEHGPDNSYGELRHAAACFTGTSPENIVPCNGVSGLLMLILSSLVNSGDTVILPQPCPAEYHRICKLFGLTIQKAPMHEILQLPDEVLKQAKALVFSNPNDPTGELISKDMLSGFAKRCARQELLLIVDESFIELSDPAQSIADIATRQKYLIVIRSLVNAFSLPGIAFAYGITMEAEATGLNAIRSSCVIDAFTEAIATAVLSMEGGVNSGYLTQSRDLIHEGRQYIIDRLSPLYGFGPRKSAASFVLVDMGEHFIESMRFTKYFSSRGILLRECSDLFEGQQHFIRISVRPREDTDRLISKIDDVYAEFGREEAREKLEATLGHASEKTVASRGTCSYYPCHFHGQDCTFCFCPFYTCNDVRTGGEWINSATGGKVWSCEHCTLMHQPQVAEHVLHILMEDDDTDENIKKAWEKVILPILQGKML